MNESHILYAHEELLDANGYRTVERDFISKLTLSHQFEKRYTLFAPQQAVVCSTYTFRLPDFPDNVQPDIVRFLGSKFTYLPLTLLCAGGNVFCLTCAQIHEHNYHLRITLERRPLGMQLHSISPIAMVEDTAVLW